jgi:FixJ family two-component response regulator
VFNYFGADDLECDTVVVKRNPFNEGCYQVLGSGDAERQVGARVEAGISARQLAAESGIAETTVITHRSSASVPYGSRKPP